MWEFAVPQEGTMPARAAEESLADVDEHARYGREFRSEAERRKIANYTLSALRSGEARTWDTANWHVPCAKLCGA